MWHDVCLHEDLNKKCGVPSRLWISLSKQTKYQTLMVATKYVLSSPILHEELKVVTLEEVVPPLSYGIEAWKVLASTTDAQFGT
jgi:hypothetical protein